MIETIKGQRVNLRRVTRSDAASIARHANDVTVARNSFIPHPYDLKNARDFIRRSRLMWIKGEAYFFGIEDASNGEIIGGIGLEIISKKHLCIEAGYWLSRQYRGQGLATEALQLLLKFGFKELKQVRIQAHVMDGNEKSVRVLERCGFKYEGTERKRIKHRGRWRDMMLFSILKQEYRSR